jgi:adenylate kinase family enzyme
MKPFICIITGPAGAGKTTVSDRLAKLFDKSARINVDEMRSMIKSGYVRPYPHTSEAKKQIKLANKATCQLAKNFVSNGFNVFIDDVVLANSLKAYCKSFEAYSVHMFLLLPKKEVVIKRDTGRRKDQIIGERAIELHDKFSKIKSNWHIIDSSTHTVKQTVTEIFEVIKTR